MTRIYLHKKVKNILVINHFSIKYYVFHFEILLLILSLELCIELHGSRGGFCSLQRDAQQPIFDF